MIKNSLDKVGLMGSTTEYDIANIILILQPREICYFWLYSGFCVQVTTVGSSVWYWHMATDSTGQVPGSRQQLDIGAGLGLTDSNQTPNI